MSGLPTLLLCALAVTVLGCSHAEPAPSEERTTTIDPTPSVAQRPAAPAAPEPPATRLPVGIGMQLPAGPTVAVSATQPLLGCVTSADDGSDWGFYLMLIDRGHDDRPPPPPQQRLGYIDPPLSMEMTARSEVSIPARHLTLVGYERACDVPIERALEVYGTFPDGGEPPHRFIGLIFSSRCDGDGAALGVVGAPVRVRSLETPLSPVPPTLRPILARSDRAAVAQWGEAPGPDDTVIPGTLELADGLVYLRGTYRNQLLVRGTHVVYENELGGTAFRSFAETGSRRLLAMTTSVDDVVIDLETHDSVSFCTN